MEFFAEKLKARTRIADLWGARLGEGIPSAWMSQDQGWARAEAKRT